MIRFLAVLAVFLLAVGCQSTEPDSSDYNSSEGDSGISDDGDAQPDAPDTAGDTNGDASGEDASSDDGGTEDTGTSDTGGSNGDTGTDVSDASNGVTFDCEGTEPAHLTRSSYCIQFEEERNCYYYEETFGGPFPGTTITRHFRQATDEYTALEFHTADDMNPDATGKWAVEAPAPSSGISTTGNKIWSISDCPGDFDQQRIEAHPDLGEGCYIRPIMAVGSIRWGGEDYLGADNRCGLQPGQTYYLNIIYTDSPGGTEPDNLEWGCGEGNDICGNVVTPVYNNYN